MGGPAGIAGCSKRLSSEAAGELKPEEVPTPHFVGPFAHTMDLGERKSPSSTADLRESRSVR